jgi:hypothetical protein
LELLHLSDDIKGTKSIMESTLTELKDDERVLRFNVRGTVNYSVYAFDRNWNIVESPNWKYEPHLGTGVPNPLAVGSQSTTELLASRKQQGEWTEPAPATSEAKIAAVETVTTKAGKFETYRIETSATFSAAESETNQLYWFAPKIDHWVKTQYERRSGGRLVEKTSQELIEYKIK